MKVDPMNWKRPKLAGELMGGLKREVTMIATQAKAKSASASKAIRRRAGFSLDLRSSFAVTT
jgi:hypothetical protein